MTDTSTTARFAALAHRFTVRCNDADLAARLDDVLEGLRTPEIREAATVYELRVDPISTEWTLSVDGVDTGPALPHPKYKIEHLMWLVNRAAVSESPRLTRVHAAVAELDGVGVVLPAAMEAGKSTLVTALVQRGFRYLSDEVAAIDPASGDLVAYSKPVGLDPGSWSIFPELRPPGDPRPFERQWLVNPNRIAPGAVTDRAVAGLIVAPTYRPGAASAPERVDRVTALRLLVDQTFRFRDHAQRDMDVLARLVRTAPCYGLHVDDLDVACEHIAALVSDHVGART